MVLPFSIRMDGRFVSAIRSIFDLRNSDEDLLATNAAPAIRDVQAIVAGTFIEHFVYHPPRIRKAVAMAIAATLR